MVARPKRDEIWLVSLDPTLGSEIEKTRPCLVVSPDDLNLYLRTIIVAPMTTSERSYPSRIRITFGGTQGQVALDQMRAVDRLRLIKRLGIVAEKTAQAVSSVLQEMFNRE